MSAPVVKWRKMAVPKPYEDESSFARYRGWTLDASRIGNQWRCALHRFVAGGTDTAYCQQRYPTLERAQNAAEFYAEKGRFPHSSAGWRRRCLSRKGTARLSSRCYQRAPATGGFTGTCCRTPRSGSSVGA